MSKFLDIDRYVNPYKRDKNNNTKEFTVTKRVSDYECLCKTIKLH